MAHCPQRASEPALRAARAAAACVKRALAKTQSTSVEKDGGPFKAREKQVLVFQPPGKRGAKKKPNKQNNEGRFAYECSPFRADGMHAHAKSERVGGVQSAKLTIFFFQTGQYRLVIRFIGWALATQIKVSR